LILLLNLRNFLNRQAIRSTLRRRRFQLWIVSNNQVEFAGLLSGLLESRNKLSCPDNCISYWKEASFFLFSLYNYSCWGCNIQVFLANLPRILRFFSSYSHHVVKFTCSLIWLYYPSINLTRKNSILRGTSRSVSESDIRKVCNLPLS
jgi:hypothetical protein